MKRVERAIRLGPSVTTKRILDYVRARNAIKRHRVAWESLISKQPQYLGVNTNARKDTIVVSLTSFPARTRNCVEYAVQSLLCQSLKPDKLVLWLASEQYPNKELDLPNELLELKKHGLKICWCDDYKSYKKLVPSMRSFPGSIIMTFDDDVIYRKTAVEKLYKAYLKNSECVHCHRATKFVKDQSGFWQAVPGGYDVYPGATYLNKLTGAGGVCYPPLSYCPELTDPLLFMSLAPTNDDIWFWLMLLKSGVKCNVVEKCEPYLVTVPRSQEESLKLVNDNGEKLFWKQFSNVLAAFPEIGITLDEEWENMSAKAKKR